MIYFKTTSISNTQYTADVICSGSASSSYTINVAVVNLIEPFVPTDYLGYASYADSTYLISSSPEMLNTNQHKGEYGYYLQRGKLKARATMYWEHYNQFNISMSFGVLLWNKGTTPIIVSLNARSVKTLSGSSSMEQASTGVWVDRFNNVKQSDQSELPTNGSVTIPAYSSSNPSASTLWVAMSSVPTGFFNGVLALELKNTDGSLYTGSNLYCDTYIITPNYEYQIKPAIARLSLAQTSDTLRGSGTGACLYATITDTITITSSNPYNFLITGNDTPNLQSGEKMSLTTYNKDGSTVILQHNMNYGVKYVFKFSKFSSSGIIKAKIKCNRLTNYNNAASQTAGLYVAGFIYSQQVFGKLITTTSPEYVFSSNVPKNQEVILNIVVSGMSALPLEISFYN